MRTKRSDGFRLGGEVVVEKRICLKPPQNPSRGRKVPTSLLLAPRTRTSRELFFFFFTSEFSESFKFRNYIC